MSDHISGPRALAEPIADITDVYAFPSPERPGRLVLVMNTLPFAQPSARFSDGLIYRFRLRPVTPATGDDPGLFEIGAEEFAFDCVFSAPVSGSGGGSNQDGACITPAGETVSFRVNDERGGSAHGVRVFAGPRWDPFILDAPAALKTIATGQLAFTDPSAIFLDGKNVLSLVVEVDCARLLERRGAGRGGRRDPDPRHDHRPPGTRRAARGEEPPAGAQAVRHRQPRSGDPRPVQQRGRVPARAGLPRRLSGAAERQPRILGPPGRQAGLARGFERCAPADRTAAGRLPCRGRHQALRRAGLLPGDRAGHPGGPPTPDLRGPDPQRRRDGHAVHAPDQRGERAHDPRRRRPGRQYPLPALSRIWRRRTRTLPSLPSTSRNGDVHGHRERAGYCQPRVRRHPKRGAPPPTVALRRHLRAAAHRRPRGGAGADAATRPGGQRRPARLRPGPRRLGHRCPHLPGAAGARRTARVARQLPAGVPGGHGGPRGGAGRRRREQPGQLGEAARNPRRPRGAGGAVTRRRATGGGGRAGTPRPSGAARGRGDLAPGLLPAPYGAHLLRLQGRDRPAGGGGQRHPRLQPPGATDQGRRVPPRLPRRDGQPATHADP